MASFRLRKATTQSRPELRATAEALAAELRTAHGVRSHWESEDVVAIRGAGVEGRLTLEENAVEVSVRLGLLASAFQGPLRAEIERYLEQHIS